MNTSPKKDSIIYPVVLTLITVIVFIYLALFVHQTVVSYLALGAGTYLLLGAWYHHKKTSLTWTVVVEYLIIVFLVWFVLVSLVR